MSSRSVRSTHESFIVRIWKESGATAPWRGQLQHVRSGETISIADMKNISAELEAYLQKAVRENPGLK